MYLTKKQKRNPANSTATKVGGGGKKKKKKISFFLFFRQEANVIPIGKKKKKIQVDLVPSVTTN